MLQLRRRIGLGVEVADLLELQRAFAARPRSRRAADEEGVLGVLEVPGQLTISALAREDRRDLVGQRLQRRDQPRAVGDREIAQPAEMDGEQRQRDRGAGEGLGRDDRDLRAGVEVDAAVRTRGRSCCRPR